tara:strand:+ start:656 stop:1384 length:729 start_codon:yes stop_codon:yes gene_type:complete
MPTRYLKPGVRDSASIDQLTPMAENLFYRLLVTVDDFGRYDARPALIKSHCFPIKESVSIKKCEELLMELQSAGLLLIYEVDGKQYIQMTKWDNVPRSKTSKFPQMYDGCIQTYTDAQQLHTNLPVTVTVTGTETETGTKTETTLRVKSFFDPPKDVSQEVWSDFMQIRKAKRSPITNTALEQIRKEALKAGWTLEDAIKECVSRGWQSFKADWIANSSSKKQEASFEERVAEGKKLLGFED